jgi:signal transduction histidine kinase
MSALAFKTMKPHSTANPGDIDPVLVADFGCTSTLAVPLHLGDKPLGVLCLIERREPRVFAPQDVRLASHAANLIAVALENARLYAEQRARAEEMARLNDLSQSLVGAIELQPILDQAARLLREMLDASNCFILLYDQKSRELRGAAGPPQLTEFTQAIRIPIDAPHSMSATSLRERRPMVVSDVDESTIVKREYAQLLGEKSAVALPLFARHEPVGVVLLDDTRRKRTFTQSEIDRAASLARLIALAILAARLVEDLRSSYAELARAQAELVERERLAVVGELSASIAHEVRNPLGVIFNSLGSLRRMLGNREGDVKLLLDIVGEEAERLNHIVGDLLDFARPMKPALQPTQLLPLLEDAVVAARAQVADNPPEGAQKAEVRVQVSPEVATVPADPQLLRQAVVNLVLNALQALQRGGTVRIRAERQEADRGPQALLHVRDSGPGIAPSLRERVFQPFFTTKAKGTGLGLAVVKRIAEGHGGSVALRELPEGEGAEFTLSLPL